ncbi:hypothetical protein D3C81_2289470 [compost metagenome]
MAFLNASINITLAIPLKWNRRIVDIVAFNAVEDQLGAFIDAFGSFELLTQVQ